MPSIQIRKISDAAYAALKSKAKTDRRSLQQEAAWILETMLAFPRIAHQPEWNRVDQIRKLMAQRYGTLPDSTSLIRQMRDER